MDLDSVALNSFDTFRNYSAVEGAPRTIALANSILIAAPNNLFHWFRYLIYHTYNPKNFIETSVRLPILLARKYPHYINVDYSYLARPHNAERIYFIQDGWLWELVKTLLCSFLCQVCGIISNRKSPRASLSRGISVQGGLCPGGSLFLPVIITVRKSL